MMVMGRKGRKLTRNALPSPRIHVFMAYVGAPEFVQRGSEFRALFSAREVYRSARFPTEESLAYLRGFTPYKQISASASKIKRYQSS